MELTLNLCWLMLAVPVILLCWNAPQFARGSRNYRHFHFCMLAICLLALLFPVVSASDDLAAMRAESEESSIARAGIKSWALDSSNSHSPASYLAAVDCHFSEGFRNAACGIVSTSPQTLPDRVFFYPVGDRAPPLS